MSQRLEHSHEDYAVSTADRPTAGGAAVGVAAPDIAVERKARPRPSHARKRGPLALLLGRKLKLQREHLRLTQADLAERAMLSLKYLGEIERGEANVTLDALERVALALDWNPWSLFDSAPQPIAANLHELLVGRLTDQTRAMESLKELLLSLAPAARCRALTPEAPYGTRALPPKAR